jgi:hypothetical protein
MPFFAITSPSSGNATQLQANPVSATEPETNQVLTWNGSAWVPAAGTPGPEGPSGTDGTRLYAGEGAPSSGFGISGDWWIDTTEGAPRLYGPKASGAWGSGVPLMSIDLPIETSDVDGLDDLLDLKADLVAGKVPAEQLPSYVDDVLEFEDFEDLPITGESGKIYVTLDDGAAFRWGGSAYFEVSPSDVTSVNGETGDVVLDHTDVGLGNVDNTSDANKPVSTATQAALDALEAIDTAAPLTVLVNADDTLSGYIGEEIGDNAFENSTAVGLRIGNGVTSIGGYAFSYCSGFTGSLTIPDSVTSIGGSAFSGCSGFTGSLTIPNGVTSIDAAAFYGCSGFTGSLTIPNGVTSIGGSAFYGCSGFTGSLTIPNGVTSIGSYAFYGCYGFTGSLTIPNGVTSIGGSAFSYCSGFTGSLTIPDSVTSIGGSAFSGCSGFTGSLTIPDSVTSIGGSAFSGCPGFTGSLTIPNGVTSIGDSAFTGCSGFTGSLTIPNGVTSIGSYAFSYCSGFTSVNSYVTKTILNQTNVFVGCSSLTTIHAQAADGTWTAGADTIGGLAVTVVKDL